jgi:hypothetical protein
MAGSASGKQQQRRLVALHIVTLARIETNAAAERPQAPPRAGRLPLIARTVDRIIYAPPLSSNTEEAFDAGHI